MQSDLDRRVPRQPRHLVEIAVETGKACQMMVPHHRHDQGVSREEAILLAKQSAGRHKSQVDRQNLDGARVYLLINGQLIDARETTPAKLGPIVARTFAVALKHMSRAQVVAVDQIRGRPIVPAVDRLRRGVIGHRHHAALCLSCPSPAPAGEGGARRAAAGG